MNTLRLELIPDPLLLPLAIAILCAALFHPLVLLAGIVRDWRRAAGVRALFAEVLDRAEELFSPDNSPQPPPSSPVPGFMTPEMMKSAIDYVREEFAAARGAATAAATPGPTVDPDYPIMGSCPGAEPKGSAGDPVMTQIGDMLDTLGGPLSDEEQAVIHKMRAAAVGVQRPTSQAA